MNEQHPELARFLRQHARELAQITPSQDLDARIDALVAAPVKNISAQPAVAGRRRASTPPRLLLAAGIAALAIGIGIVVGVRLERRATVHAPMAPPRALGALELAGTHGEPLPSMWPVESVAIQVPAEMSASGALVPVKQEGEIPEDARGGARYWVDIVVSNDGTVRIERIVPAGRELESAPLPIH
jgi:hypothetical protein